MLMLLPTLIWIDAGAYLRSRRTGAWRQHIRCPKGAECRVGHVETRDIDRDGTRLHALWQPGTGTPLVIVPGVMTDATGWRRVADALDRPEPVLILNRRGRAPSGPLGRGYGINTEVLDLLTWLDWLGEPVRLFGWSYGGLIAIEAATRTIAVRHVIAYEPVMRPFGAAAVPTFATTIV